MDRESDDTLLDVIFTSFPISETLHPSPFDLVKEVTIELFSILRLFALNSISPELPKL